MNNKDEPGTMKIRRPDFWFTFPEDLIGIFKEKVNLPRERLIYPTKRIA
jgi:hypothetical protein